MRLRLGCVALALAVLWVPQPAVAHDAPFSYLDLDIQDGFIDATLLVHVIDVATVLEIEPIEAILEQARAERELARLTPLLDARMRLEADGEALIPEWLGVETVPAEQSLLLRFRFTRPRPRSVTVWAHYFPYDPPHQTFVNVFEFGDIRQQSIFTADSDARIYFSGTTQGSLAVLSVFIPSGIEHIMIGPDHVLFLVGLLLLGGGWISLVRIVTAFTIGHSVTLSLAALNIVNLPAQLIEPAIALSIVFVGADNLARGEGRDVRAWIALVFGLVHGFGFANVLREFGLPAEALGWSLFSFNVGVEIGQLGIVVVVTSILALIRQRSAALGARVATVGSVVVIAAGAWWFVERVFLTGGA
jgi:hydrogenase/urease accessory protein HupE